MKYLAIALLCFLAVLRPDHVEPQTADLVVQGRQALDADRPDDAIALFEKAVVVSPVETRPEKPRRAVTVRTCGSRCSASRSAG